jgi:hypothetical protein
MRLRIPALALLSILATLGLDVPGAVKPRAAISDPDLPRCVVGRTSAPIGFWTWPANSQVNIYLREPDFSADYVSAVRVAVQNWDAAAAENGSNVHFTFHGLTRETRTAHGDMTITRGDVYDKKVKHLALLEAHSLRSDQLIDYALVVVDIRVKNPDVLTNVMAHEIGHSLGLLDCYECQSKTTAMGLMKTSNEPNGIDGPTGCDKIGVRAAYRELALHVRPSPTALTVNKPPTDPGEDPEADDTPIIRRPQ